MATAAPSAGLVIADTIGMRSDGDIIERSTVAAYPLLAPPRSDVWIGRRSSTPRLGPDELTMFEASEDFQLDMAQLIVELRVMANDASLDADLPLWISRRTTYLADPGANGRWAYGGSTLKVSLREGAASTSFLGLGLMNRGGVSVFAAEISADMNTARGVRLVANYRTLLEGREWPLLAGYLRVPDGLKRRR